MKCFITNRECKYEDAHAEANQHGSIFMLSPFGFPFDDLYRLGIQRIVGETNITRGDQSLQLGYVMCQRICRRILQATHVFVDLTEPNGNVYYEMGLAYGLGKRIVLLWNERSRNPHFEAFRAIAQPLMSYQGVEDLRRAPFRDCMDSAFHLPGDVARILKINAPHIVLAESPVVLNVVNEDCPAADLHEYAARTAINSYNAAAETNGRPRLEDWRVDTLVVGKSFNREDAVQRLAQAKVCLFDMTHYSQKANGYIFFLLGVAHATGREVIPIINRPLNRNVPFDIRGLWQVNFEAAEELESELEQILPTIDADFKKEKGDYLYHQIWDPFLTQKSIRVITCAREASNPEERGKRTNVDMWDFTSVAELSFFIAQKFETATVNTGQPNNKKGTEELQSPAKDRYHAQLREDLRGQDCVIIGSPDVSDYAELVLAQLYGVGAHRPDTDPARLPYVFIKRTKDEDHPRRQSVFYRIPKEGEDDGVEFGRSRMLVGCREFADDDKDGRVYRGHTCVVITIARNPFDRAGEHAEHSIVILSGFTGVATYAAMKFLTSGEPQYRAQLEKYFARRKEKQLQAHEEIVGVNILLSVDYTKRDDQDRRGDTRELSNVEFREVELICASEATIKTTPQCVPGPVSCSSRPVLTKKAKAAAGHVHA